MHGSHLIATLMVLTLSTAATSAPVPPAPANQAPHPRLIRPDISLIVTEILPNGADRLRAHLHRVGFRNGKVLPAETTVWEGDEDFCSPCGTHHLVANRLLVTDVGGVIDLRENKVLHDERDGEVECVTDTNVVYRIRGDTRVNGVFACEYATGIVTRLGPVPPLAWHYELDVPTERSADGKKAIEWRGEDELVLHREGEKPKSLGKGFRMEQDPKVKSNRSRAIMQFPVLWLDDSRFLTQRDNGKPVIVRINGKVTEVAPIKDAPKVAVASLFRDRVGAIIYELDYLRYNIDPVKKTAVKCEWYGLGHGFEASWEKDEKERRTLRHNGKEIGRLDCWAFASKTAPGYVALPVGEKGDAHPRKIAVWSVATGEWTMLTYGGWLSPDPLVGWIK